MSPDEILYLCNYDDQIKTDNETINKLWSEEWSLKDIGVCKELLASGLESEFIEDIVKRCQNSKTNLEEVLFSAISAILTYCERNWNPKLEKLDLKEFFGVEWPTEVNVLLKLEQDSEPVNINTKNPELLYFSSQLFNALCNADQNMLYLWWNLRSKVAHQRVLEETSQTLYSQIDGLIAKLTNLLPTIKDKPRLQILLYLEMAQAYHVYGRVQKVEEYLAKVKELAGLKFELIGVLGKRTRYQQKSLAQLALSTELDPAIERPPASTSHSSCQLPPNLELQDDVRLNKIQYAEEISQAELPSLEQILFLLTVQHLMKMRPKDEILNEEILPYLETILNQKNGAWSTRVATLLIRCKLESKHKRTVERAMQQCETIVNNDSGATSTSRLSYLWATGIQQSWTWRKLLGDLYISVGLVKAALEEYLALQEWGEVVSCYTLLQLRHKAAEVLRNQIEIKPTVKLYCLLGDATDDVECYKNAWDFSNHKSSGAQRHWGNFLFHRGKFQECIPHYQLSLKINSLQEIVWHRMAFAALESEQLELAGKAYRHYTYLQPQTFEAWNNLAKVYVQQKDNNRAYRAFMEALKYNYDNWKLWENVMLLSVRTNHFEDMIRGCHRIMDLKEKYEDIELLSLLVRAVVENKEDADGNGARRLQKRVLELFGRITSIHQNIPEIWQLYADLTDAHLLRAQRLQKAYRGYTQTGTWVTDPQTCNQVILLCQGLLDESIKARKEAEEKNIPEADRQLSSARLTGQAVIRAAEKQDFPEIKSELEKLKSIFTLLTEYLQSIL